MNAAMPLSDFNQLKAAEAAGKLLEVCHCSDWAALMAAARPFTSTEAIKDQALALWQQCTEAQRLEAFSGHARIGDIDAIRRKYATATEQGQVLEAPEAVLEALALLNRRYEQKNGFIFIVCASGLSAPAMLDKLKQRIDNDRTTELDNASAEQWKIMALRIDRYFQDN